MSIYELPNSVTDLFQEFGNGVDHYRMIDYDACSMDNEESMQYFLDRIGATCDDIVENYGTQVVFCHPDYGHKLVVDSGGLGDFYSHGFDVSLYED